MAGLDRINLMLHSTLRVQNFRNTQFHQTGTVDLRLMAAWLVSCVICFMCYCYVLVLFVYYFIISLLCVSYVQCHIQIIRVVSGPKALSLWMYFHQIFVIFLTKIHSVIILRHFLQTHTALTNF